MLLCGSVFYSFLFSKNIPLYEFTIIAYPSLLLDFCLMLERKSGPVTPSCLKAVVHLALRKDWLRLSIYCIRAITILQLSDATQHPKHTLFRGVFGHEIYERRKQDPFQLRKHIIGGVLSAFIPFQPLLPNYRLSGKS